MSRAVLFAFSNRGMETSLRIMALLKAKYDCSLYVPQKYIRENAEALPMSIGRFTGEVFDDVQVLIYVGACGIAVRSIAPYLKSKTTDPAVICVDEKGEFCISLLSGHIGGGNRLTRELAEKLCAVPVITTATDLHHRFSVDDWAKRKGFCIADMKMAKEISAAILERDLPICADCKILGELPGGLFEGECGDLGISVSIYQKHPFSKTLSIIPRVLTLGIGCRKGTSKEKIEDAVQRVLEEHKLDFRAVSMAASIDLKAKEEGLLAFCQEHGLAVRFYSAEELSQVKGKFSSSDFVRSITGVDNVCERSALASGGNLLIRKTVCDGVTIAVVQRDWSVDFEE